MVYSVHIDYIAFQIDDEVQEKILEFIKTYAFPYITEIKNKDGLKEAFTEHFEKCTQLKDLAEDIAYLAKKEGLKLDVTESLSGMKKKTAMGIARTETNRLHTMGLGQVLLSKGIRKCTTENFYGTEPIPEASWKNLESEPQTINDITVKGKPKIFDIEEILKNTFPDDPKNLERNDVPMIPQVFNGRHIMVPIKE